MSRKTLFPPIGAVAACLLLLVFVACDGKNVVPEPELLDRAPDPDKGYQYLLARIYGQSFGLTTESVQEIWTVWPPALREAARNASPEERMRMIYDRYGLLDPPEEDIPGRPPGVPVNLNADTAGVLYTNCLLCHSGELMGTTIHGMNNTHVAIRIRFKIPIWSNSDGTSNAFYVAAQWGTFRVGARGRGGELSPDLARLPRRDVPPLPQWATEAPDWFNSRKKNLYYRDGFIEDTPGDLMQFTMSANHPELVSRLSGPARLDQVPRTAEV